MIRANPIALDLSVFNFGLSALLIVGILTGLGCASTKSSPQRKWTFEKKWVRSTLAKDFLRGRRIHRTSPVLTPDLVFTANAIDGVVALERSTAREIWRISIKDGVEGGLVLHNGLLYFGASDGQLYAVEALTGIVRWNYPLNAEGLARPLVEGGQVFVLGGNNVLHAMDSLSGKLLWVYNRRDPSPLSIRGGSTPVVYKNHVIVGFSDGTLAALKKTSGALAWEARLGRQSKFRDVDSTPVLDGSRVYVSSYDGALYCVDAESGEILWTFEEGGYDPVVVAGQRLIFGSSSNKVISVDKRTGKKIWEHSLNNHFATGPALLGSFAIMGLYNGPLLAFDLRTGQKVASYSTGRGVTSIPSVDVDSREIFVMTLDANIYVLTANPQDPLRLWAWEK